MKVEKHKATRFTLGCFDTNPYKNNKGGRLLVSPLIL